MSQDRKVAEDPETREKVLIEYKLLNLRVVFLVEDILVVLQFT